MTKRFDIMDSAVIISSVCKQYKLKLLSVSY